MARHERGPHSSSRQRQLTPGGHMIKRMLERAERRIWDRVTTRRERDGR